MSEARLWVGGPIFDGTRLLEDHAVLVSDGRIEALGPATDLAREAEVLDLDGDILCPGFVDLQVNGGGGVMLGEAAGVETVRRIAEAHRSLGTGHLLPTLISDTPDTTRRVIAAVTEAIAEGVPGVAGLHLEGPHLDPQRAGAHDPGNLRAMTAEDVALLVEARRRLPCLLVTLAPEAATEAQVAELSRSGICVSLGHTNADYDITRRYLNAGARMATHLFNAMAPMVHRAPGLVGAVLSEPSASFGLIADGHHVHPAVLGVALRASRGNAFLVSDAMAVAGTQDKSFRLGVRVIARRDGRLLLADGTLAGADLDLCSAIGVLVDRVGIDLPLALAMATSRPARAAGLGQGAGYLAPGARSMTRIDRSRWNATPIL